MYRDETKNLEHLPNVPKVHFSASVKYFTNVTPHFTSDDYGVIAFAFHLQEAIEDAGLSVDDDWIMNITSGSTTLDPVNHSTDKDVLCYLSINYPDISKPFLISGVINLYSDSEHYTVPLGYRVFSYNDNNMNTYMAKGGFFRPLRGRLSKYSIFVTVVNAWSEYNFTS